MRAYLLKSADASRLCRRVIINMIGRALIPVLEGRFILFGRLKCVSIHCKSEFYMAPRSDLNGNARNERGVLRASHRKITFHN